MLKDNAKPVENNLLEIPQDFTFAEANDTVVFIVNGNIYIDGNVTRIPGLHINSQTFTIGYGSGRFILDGMVYTSNLNLNRSYYSFTTPAYQFIYQPRYLIVLLPYLGRSAVTWKEIGP